MISSLVVELMRRRSILNSSLCPNRVVDTSVFVESVQENGPNPISGPGPVTPGSATISNYSDHNTNRAALARYGIERNPGPDSGAALDDPS